MKGWECSKKSGCGLYQGWLNSCRENQRFIKESDGLRARGTRNTEEGMAEYMKFHPKNPPCPCNHECQEAQVEVRKAFLRQMIEDKVLRLSPTYCEFYGSKKVLKCTRILRWLGQELLEKPDADIASMNLYGGPCHHCTPKQKAEELARYEDNLGKKPDPRRPCIDLGEMPEMDELVLCWLAKWK